MDKRSPFVLSLLDLPRSPGSLKSYDFTFIAPDDFGVEMLKVPAGQELEVEIDLHSVSEGVLVQGRISASAQGVCSRCLTSFTQDFSEKITELVYYPEQIPQLLAEGDEEAEDFPIIEDDHIDLEPILRDALVLAMPFTPVCKKDCVGLCAQCGQAWEDLPEDHTHEFLDPRFAALDTLLAQFATQTETENVQESMPTQNSTNNSEQSRQAEV